MLAFLLLVLPSLLDSGALQLAVDARHRIRSADVHIRIEGVDPATGAPIARARRSVVAGDCRAAFSTARREGTELRAPIAELTGPGGWWLYEQGGIVVRHWEAPPTETIGDIRGLGFAPDGALGGSPKALLAALATRHGGVARVCETATDDLVLVRAELLDGTEMCWTIDPARDWNPVRVEARNADGLIAACRIDLKRAGEHWFPVKVEHTRGAAAHVVETFLVESVVLNDPDGPTELTPSDIGVEPGMAVMPQDRQRARQGQRWWDGSRLLTADEYRVKALAGEIKAGPTIWAFRRKNDPDFDESRVPEAYRLGAPGAEVRHVMGPDTIARLGLRGAVFSLWERYTTQFAERYQLDGPQQTRARIILHDCQAAALQHLLRCKGAVERLDSSLRGTGATRPAGIDEGARQKLIEPLNRIFETQLKPRLDKLPTRMQRVAAERAPATAPAAP